MNKPLPGTPTWWIEELLFARAMLVMHIGGRKPTAEEQQRLDNLDAKLIDWRVQEIAEGQ
jgi:hypothetical protein